MRIVVAPQHREAVTYCLDQGWDPRGRGIVLFTPASVSMLRGYRDADVIVLRAYALPSEMLVMADDAALPDGSLRGVVR